MSNPVNIELPGELDVKPADKIGLQKYVNEVELVIQQFRSGAGAAVLLSAISQRKPWTQFAATDNFKVPASLPRLTRRLKKNIEHFQSNYLIVSLGLFAYCLITSPLLLIAMAGSFYCCRKLTSGPNNWKIGSYEVSKPQQYTVGIISSMIIMWLVGAGAVLFWVIGATATFVFIHASFFDSEAIAELQDPEKFSMVEQV